jgi:hypothetical protein
VVRPQAAVLEVLGEEDNPINVDLFAPNSPAVRRASLISIGEKPVNGRVSLNHDEGTATYSPHKAFFGQDTFTYRGSLSYLFGSLLIFSFPRN